MRLPLSARFSLLAFYQLFPVHQIERIMKKSYILAASSLPLPSPLVAKKKKSRFLQLCQHPLLPLSRTLHPLLLLRSPTLHPPLLVLLLAQLPKLPPVLLLLSPTLSKSPELALQLAAP